MNLDRLDGGLGDDRDLSDFDYDSLLEGLKVEREHTDKIDIALEIVMDHLTEDADYYDKLKLIEGGMREDLVAEELVKIARLIEGADSLVPEYKKIYQGMESLRGKFKGTSNEAILVGILRDMVMKVGKGQWSSVERLAKSIKKELESELGALEDKNRLYD
jgi:hypothetical protein